MTIFADIILGCLDEVQGVGTVQGRRTTRTATAVPGPHNAAIRQTDRIIILR